ncbi:hypothetical protein SCHPADRAFT_904660 [Schizopora paradoxa]|uniref:Uncharacterized protein n=1 Tax=Schizopora paradoxa TaxID=27342 RepID=A0A0H2RU32_9AGAM|nr:hypothetical protein SCHPADRAFT_904660 [Schizopora paradoxa]
MGVYVTVIAPVPACSRALSCSVNPCPILRAPEFLSQQSLNMRSLTLSMCISRGLLNTDPPLPRVPSNAQS